VIWVSEFTTNDALIGPVCPLNVTRSAPEKLVPVIVTLVPAAPHTVDSEEMVGGESTVKLAELELLPTVFVTLMGPVIAPWGTVTVTEVPVANPISVAGVPPKAI
jgi:hypothetical protein